MNMESCYGELADVLRIHALRYPLMQPQDGVKLIYQNEFGGGHLIADPDRAIAYLHREYAQIEKNSEFVAEESIGNGIYRIHLQSLNREDVEELGQAFLASAKTHTGSMEVFLEKLEILRRLTGENAFCFSLEELDEYLTEYKKAGYPMVSHSEAYRNAYHPAYRIVKK